MITTLQSKEDASVNFTIPTHDGGFFESRFVQRSDDYFIVYLSSHSGCNQTCRFCHLTSTGQTMMHQATINEFRVQAEAVLNWYKNNVHPTRPAKKVHFNFMARGEPLLNDVIVNKSDALFDMLSDMTSEFDLEVKFKVSSILPESFTGDLTKIFNDRRAMLYYSLYSIDDQFRKRWLPRAMKVSKALALIKLMQDDLNRPITVHWALIEDENDSDADVDGIADLLRSFGIRCKVNIVRYNPYNERYGTESRRVNSLFNRIVSLMPDSTLSNKIVPRVGYDVKASCGMFIEKESK
jgi:23S rRNA (adenine2503-C2)-methyltransferase